ncbi:hypothetical protein CPB84DRAFT_1785425, partial [Gymnopilus junonius]
MVNYTIVTVSDHCASKCSPVTTMVESCTTVDCLCTESNIRSFEGCMNCAVGTYTYRLPVSNAQSYLESIVGSCNKAGYSFESSVLLQAPVPSFQFVRLENFRYCFIAISAYTIIELLIAVRKNKIREVGNDPADAEEEPPKEKGPFDEYL